MSAVALTRTVSPILRRGFWTLMLILIPVLAIIYLTIDTEPHVVSSGPPDAAAAERALEVAESLRTLVDTEGAAGSWSVREDQLNAVLSAAQRVAPGLLGLAEVTDDAIRIDLSAGAPILPAGLWANLHLGLTPSEQGLEVTEARLGHLPLPPAVALFALRIGLDRLLGEGMGADAIRSVAAVRVSPPTMTVALRFDEDGRAPFFTRLRDRAFEGAGADARDAVYHQLWFLDRATRADELPRKGSVLPYFREVVENAIDADGDDREAMRGALYALALYCGSPDFGQVIGVTLHDHMRGRDNGCERTHLAFRDDLKRHFAISAGLYAVTTSGNAAFGVGELKELLDANGGGEGFSFGDMVADAAGVQFAEAFLNAPRSAWPGMLAGITSEADIMPSLEGLPGGLDEAHFRARYGSVDSPDYREAVAEIDRRVAGLPLYAASDTERP